VNQRQAHLVELQRRVKIARNALDALARCLAIELESTSQSPDQLAERITNATKAAVSRGKDH
jgi:hypothetical protein